MSMDEKKKKHEARGMKQPSRFSASTLAGSCRSKAFILTLLLTGMITSAGFAKTESRAGFIEVPEITGEFTDALPIAIQDEGETMEDDVLLDFGTMPSGRLFKQRGAGKAGAARAGDRMIIVTPALMAFREYTIPELERYVVTMTNDVYARTMLGVRLFQDKRLEESLDYFRQALRINPFEVRTAELHSGMLMQQKMNPLPPSIPDEIHRLLDAHPDNNVIRFNLACAYARSGQPGAALQQLGVLARSGWAELVYHITDRDFIDLRRREEFAGLQDALLRDYLEYLNRYLLSTARPEPLAP